ncbi:MAG: molybdate ABC transporter substrate-binding protein, partial [Acidobacteriota bacterium]
MIWSLMLGLIFSGSACRPRSLETHPPELLVFAATSLSDVLGEIGGVFQSRVEVDLIFNFNGSNVLAHQILASPKADVFVSADEDWMNVVQQADRVEAGTRRSLLSNQLAIIGHAGSSREIRLATDLCRLDFRLLALGDPEAVPAGRYAKQWLQIWACQDRGLWETVAGRISPAPNVRAVIGQVEAADEILGIVYQTDFAAARDRVQLLYSVPSDDGPPIR